MNFDQNNINVSTTNRNKSYREVYLGNMFEVLPRIWNQKRESRGKNNEKTTFHYIVGIPDSAEIEPRPSLVEYLQLINDFCQTIFDASDKNSIFFFLQTDKYNREPPIWIDKMFYITSVAARNGFYPFSKKIIINDFKSNDSSRSVYTNLYGFMKIDKTVYKKNREFMKDELLYNGSKTWINGFAINAVDLCVRFIKKNSKSRDYYIVDPFIGQGSLLAVCDLHKIRSIGIDIEEEKVEVARELTITRPELDAVIRDAKDKIKKCER